VKRFKVLAAVLLLVSMMPLARACAVLSSAATAHHDCCPQKAASCCEAPSAACCATHAPADTSLFASPAGTHPVPPPPAVAVLHHRGIESLPTRCSALLWPAEHSPPGLVMVATTILRI
jgi:hypothetical protein